MIESGSRSSSSSSQSIALHSRRRLGAAVPKATLPACAGAHADRACRDLQVTKHTTFLNIVGALMMRKGDEAGLHMLDNSGQSKLFGAKDYRRFCMRAFSDDQR